MKPDKTIEPPRIVWLSSDTPPTTEYRYAGQWNTVPLSSRLRPRIGLIRALSGGVFLWGVYGWFLFWGLLFNGPNAPLVLPQTRTGLPVRGGSRLDWRRHLRRG